MAEVLATHSGDTLPPVEAMLARVRRRVSELKRREAAPERHLRLVEEVASRG